MVAFSAQALSSYLVCPSQLPKPHGQWPRPPRSPQAHVTWLAVGLRVSTGGPRDTAVAERYPHRPEIALTADTMVPVVGKAVALWLRAMPWPPGLVTAQCDLGMVQLRVCIVTRSTRGKVRGLETLITALVSPFPCSLEPEISLLSFVWVALEKDTCLAVGRPRGVAQ